MIKLSFLEASIQILKKLISRIFVIHDLNYMYHLPVLEVEIGNGLPSRNVKC